MSNSIRVQSRHSSENILAIFRVRFGIIFGLKRMETYRVETCNHHLTQTSHRHRRLSCESPITVCRLTDNKDSYQWYDEDSPTRNSYLTYNNRYYDSVYHDQGIDLFFFLRKKKIYVSPLPLSFTNYRSPVCRAIFGIITVTYVDLVDIN